MHQLPLDPKNRLDGEALAEEVNREEFNPIRALGYESTTGITCEWVFAVLSILFGSPLELLRLSGGPLIPGSFRTGVRCGARTVSPLLPRPDGHLFGGGLSFHLPTTKRRLRAGHSLHSAKESKVTSAIFVDRDGACAGSTGLSLYSALLADLSYASIDINLFSVCLRWWTAT